MTETKLARIFRIVLLFWLVASIALVVAMIVTLLPLPDQEGGRGETGSTQSGELTVESCIAATTCSPPINPMAASPFRHLNRVSYFLVQNTESHSARHASLMAK